MHIDSWGNDQHEGRGSNKTKTEKERRLFGVGPDAFVGLFLCYLAFDLCFKGREAGIP